MVAFDGAADRLVASIAAMAGHSKWAGIKHKKAIVDARRGKLFTKLARAITVAAKEGGGDPDDNPALGLAVQKAKDASMPKDNIERAIAKGTGEGSDADALEAVLYEGYGPGGVALLVDGRSPTTATAPARRSATCSPSTAATSASRARSPTCSTSAASSWSTPTRYEEDDLLPAIEAGALDVALDDDVFEILTEPSDLTAVRAALEDAGVELESSEVSQHPKTRVPIDEETATKLMRLIDALEDNDDVDEVHANFDVDAAVLERVAGVAARASERTLRAMTWTVQRSCLPRCGSAARSGSCSGARRCRCRRSHHAGRHRLRRAGPGLGDRPGLVMAAGGVPFALFAPGGRRVVGPHRAPPGHDRLRPRPRDLAERRRGAPAHGHRRGVDARGARPSSTAPRPRSSCPR